MANVSIDKLNDAIKNALDEYNESIVDGLKKTTTKAIKELVNETKSTAPVGKRSKHYKDSISSRTESESKYGLTKVWFVKGSDYRLTHLLNDGHQLKDGGRYPGTNFLSNAVEKIESEYLKQIKEVIKNG